MTRNRTRSALPLALALSCLLLPAGPAAARGPTASVSLGDSFISGQAGRWQGNSTDSHSLVPRLDENLKAIALVTGVQFLSLRDAFPGARGLLEVDDARGQGQPAVPGHERVGAGDRGLPDLPGPGDRRGGPPEPSARRLSVDA